MLMHNWLIDHLTLGLHYLQTLNLVDEVGVSIL
jgi:hypothetical protein